MRSRAGAKGAGLFLCRERVCREMDVYRNIVRAGDFDVRSGREMQKRCKRDIEEL